MKSILSIARKSSSAFGLAVGLTVTLLGSAQAAVVSTFDSDTDGWVGLRCPNPGICAAGSITLGATNFMHVGTGGNPGGYILTVDPSSETAGRVQAPEAFLNALAVGLTLSFDASITDPGNTGGFDSDIAPLVTIDGDGMTLVYAITSDDFPKIDGPWKHYDIPIGVGLGWFSFLHSNPPSNIGGVSPASASDFDTVLESRQRLTLISEWLDDEADLDTGGIDNVQIVPVPAALPLMFSALGGLGWLVRKRG